MKRLKEQCGNSSCNGGGWKMSRDTLMAIILIPAFAFIVAEMVLRGM